MSKYNQENHPGIYHTNSQSSAPLLPLLSEDSPLPFIVNVAPKRKSSKASNLLRDVLTEQEMESFSSSQIMRQFKTTNSRMGPVMSMLVAEKKRIVYCGTLDKKIRAWSISSGEILGEFEGHVGYASSLVLQPISEEIDILFSGGSDGTIRSWNVETFQCEKIFKGHKAHVNLIRVSDVFFPTILLFSASSDGTIKIWNAQTTELLHTIVMGESVHSLEIFSQPKSVHLLAASRTLKCYILSDPTSLKHLSTCEGHTDAIWSLLFFFLPPNGHFAFTGSWDRTIRLWNLNSGQCVQKYEGHMHHVYCMTTNQSTGNLYGYVDRMINKGLNSSATIPIQHNVTPVGTPITGSMEDLMGNTPFGVTNNVGEAVSKAMEENSAENTIFPEFIPDTLFTGAADGVAIGWDIMLGKQVVKFEGHKGSIEQIRYDGSWLYTASSDKTIRIWHPKTGKCLSVYIGHNSFVEHLKIVPGGIFSGGNDGTIILWCGYRQQRLSRGGSFFDFIKGIREENQILSPDGSPRRSSMEEEYSPFDEAGRPRLNSGSESVYEDSDSNRNSLMPSLSTSSNRGSIGTPLFISKRLSIGSRSEKGGASSTNIRATTSKENIKSPEKIEKKPENSEKEEGNRSLKTTSEGSLLISPNRRKFFEGLSSKSASTSFENIHQNPLFGKSQEMDKLSGGRMASFRMEKEKEKEEFNPKKQQRGISAFFSKSPTPKSPSPVKVVTNPLLGHKSLTPPRNNSPKKNVEPVEIPLKIPGEFEETSPSVGDGNSTEIPPKSETEDRLHKLMERLENNIKGDQLLIQKLQQMVTENLKEEDEHLTSRPMSGSRSFDQGSNGRPRRISMPGTPLLQSGDLNQNTRESFKQLNKNKKSRSFPDLSMRLMVSEMELIDAAQRRDHKAIQYLLRQGTIDVNGKDEEGLTALHWSCKMNDERGARLILRLGKGVKINCTDEQGSTPLHYAAEENNVAIVVSLLSLPSIDGKVLNLKRLRPADLTTSKPIQDLIKHATKTQTKGQNFGSIRVTANPLMRQRRKISSAMVSPSESRFKGVTAMNLFPSKEDPS